MVIRAAAAASAAVVCPSKNDHRIPTLLAGAFNHKNNRNIIEFE